jgi:amino acid adenylation domain-containing protein
MQTPDAPAIQAADAILTYAQLDERAEHLAAQLRLHGVTRGSRVGICMERSGQMVTAMIATMKAAAAYVPLDRAYPRARQLRIWEDADVHVAVVDEDLLPRFESTTVTAIRPIAGARTGAPRRTASSIGDPGDPVYVMYTSGSTGTPKGVVIPHIAVIRALFDPDYVELTADTVFGQGANLAFDACTFEIWAALLHGGTVVVIPTDVLVSADLLSAYIDEHGITHLWLTTSMFNQLVADGVPAFSRLDHLLVGGEALEPRWIRKVLAETAPRALTNGYGQTEYPFLTCTYRIHAAENLDGGVPIGRPTANTRVCLLDDHGSPVPPGVTGELHVGGVGLAHGYLNRGDLTAERFVADPFDPDPDARMYRTGDLASSRPDGTIEFRGRADDQVKIRGFRVEPGEVSSVLLEQPEVSEGTVIAREDDRGHRLVAYVVPRAAEPAGDALRVRLRQSLERRLPPYMVPSDVVFVGGLPTTPNGKLDRAALPAPSEATIAAERSSDPLDGRTEALLASIWRDVLGTERIGALDGFFELGGNSLMATRLVSRINRELGACLRLSDVFDARRLRPLARLIDARRAAATLVSRRPTAPRDPSEVPLSELQWGLWIINQLDRETASYNELVSYLLEGPVDQGALERALNGVIARHGALRTAIVERAGVPVQAIATSAAAELSLVDLSGDDAPERALRRFAEGVATEPFDLSRPPLLRAALAQLGRDRHVLLVTVHHIVFDAWSLTILLDDLGTLYSSEVADERSSPKDARVGYGEVILQQSELIAAADLEAQTEYWREQLSRAPPALDLPTDHPRPPVQSHRGARIDFTLGPDVVTPVIELADARGTTPFTVLLAAFQWLMARMADQSDVVTGSSIATRTAPDVERTIGFFVNTLAIRTQVEESLTLIELLDRVGATTRAAYANADIPFHRVVALSPGGRDSSRNPVVQVLFQLSEAQNARLDLAGVTARRYDAGEFVAKFDIEVDVALDGDRLLGQVNYATDLFNGSTIDQLVDDYTELLREAGAAPDRKLSEISPDSGRGVGYTNRTAET